MCVRSRLVAPDEPLLRHDLEQLQRGGVGGGPLAATSDVVDLPDGAGAALPEDAQDGQLGVGRARAAGSSSCALTIYEHLRICQRRSS